MVFTCMYVILRLFYRCTQLINADKKETGVELINGTDLNQWAPSLRISDSIPGHFQQYLTWHQTDEGHKCGWKLSLSSRLFVFNPERKVIALSIVSDTESRMDLST